MTDPNPDGWIPHSPGDPPPAALNVRMDVKFRDGTVARGMTVGWWAGKASNNWNNPAYPNAQITFYRPSKATPEDEPRRRKRSAK